MKSNVPGFLAILAGIISIIAGFSGSIILYERIFDITSAYLPPGTPPQTIIAFGWVLLILGFIPGLGGIIIAIGGVLILINKGLWGKVLIGFIISTTLIGIILSIIFAAIGGVLIAGLVGLVFFLATLHGVVFVISIVVLLLPITNEKK